MGSFYGNISVRKEILGLKKVMENSKQLGSFTSRLPVLKVNFSATCGAMRFGLEILTDRHQC